MRTVFFLLPILFAFCTNMPQSVRLDPLLHVPADTIGKGISVFVRAKDERANTSLGYRGVDTIPITTRQNICALVEEEIGKGLKMRSFQIAADTTQGTGLTISIEKIQYAVDGRFLHSNIRSETSIRATATRQNAEFSRLYKFEDKSGYVFLPSEKANQKRINALVSEALDRILNDDKLIRFLAGA